MSNENLLMKYYFSTAKSRVDLFLLNPALPSHDLHVFIRPSLSLGLQQQLSKQGEGNEDGGGGREEEEEEEASAWFTPKPVCGN